MVKILKYDNPYHKMKLKIRQIQVLGKRTGQRKKREEKEGRDWRKISDDFLLSHCNTPHATT